MPFETTQTMWSFMQDEAYVRLIAGPIGSGKSVLCCHELVRLALKQEPNVLGERKTRTLIVRNTADQLRSTTMKTFFDWFQPGVWGNYKVTERTFFMEHNLADGTRLKAEFMFIPLDHPDDVRKALSLEATFLWCNEWRELAPQVVDGLLMRLRRYPSEKDGGFTRSGAIFDTNMPDMDTWHFKQMEEPPSNWSIFIQPPAILSKEEYIQEFNEDPDSDDVIAGYDNTEWIINPNSDNLKHLDRLYYPEIIPGKTEDFLRVYLRCIYGRSMSGLPVYDKTFNPDFHIASSRYEVIRSSDYPIIIGQDFGRCPACALVQHNVRGQLVVLDELTSNNMGIETFLKTKLKPLLAQYAGCNFIVAPDPAGWAKQQIGEVSPVDVLKHEGFKVIRPVTNNPEQRIQAVERLLSRNIDGKPMLIVNPNCEVLIKGFRYGYKYRTNKIGQQDDKPLKDDYSHVADALQYACLVAENNSIKGDLASYGKRRDIKQVNYVWV